MSSLPQKLTADLKSVKSLLEKHNPRGYCKVCGLMLAEGGIARPKT